MTDGVGWICVRDRLPKDGEFVLACNDEGIMHVAKYESETLEWYLKYCLYDFDVWDVEENGPVMAWMPLPDAPTDNVYWHFWGKEDYDGETD